MNGLPIAFDPYVFTYTIPVSLYNGATLQTAVVGTGANAYFLNGTMYYSPVNVVIDVTHPIVVNVVSTIYPGTSKSYQISLRQI
jgi:hypothetical protein